MVTRASVLRAAPEPAGVRELVRDAPSGGSRDAAGPPPRLLDRVCSAIRTRHYSRRTERAYVGWIRRFILFHDKRHAADMGGPEVTRFLTHLAVDEHVSASTQNQALSAVLFLYREVLRLELPWLDDVVRAKRPAHLPIVLTRDEVARSSPSFTVLSASWGRCCTALVFGSSNAAGCA
jgi:hypothetical protein